MKHFNAKILAYKKGKFDWIDEHIERGTVSTSEKEIFEDVANFWTINHSQAVIKHDGFDKRGIYCGTAKLFSSWYKIEVSEA